jgi:hypothetical protein
VNPWLTSWRPHRRRWDDPRESRRRGVKAEPRGGQRRRLDDGEQLYPRAVSKGRGTAASRGDIQLNGGEDLLTPERYRLTPSTSWTGGGTNRGEEIVGGEDRRAGGLIHNSHCTMAMVILMN